MLDEGYLTTDALTHGYKDRNDAVAPLEDYQRSNSIVYPMKVSLLMCHMFSPDCLAIRSRRLTLKAYYGDAPLVGPISLFQPDEYIFPLDNLSPSEWICVLCFKHCSTARILIFTALNSADKLTKALSSPVF